MKQKLLLCLVFVFCVLLLTACTPTNPLQPNDPDDTAETETEKLKPTKGLELTLSEFENYYIVTGIGEAKDEKLVIPETYKDLEVREIAAGAFRNCDFITSVVVPEQVGSIGEGAFEGCNSMVEITVPFVGEEADSLRIYEGGYYYSYSQSLGFIFDDAIPSSLEKVVVTDDRYIWTEAFRGCQNVKTITILGMGEGESQIFHGAFQGCSSLESITLPFVGGDEEKDVYKKRLGYIFGQTPYDGAVEVEQGNRRFSNDQVKTYYIPSTLKHITILGTEETVIPTFAFQNISSLESITLGKNVSKVEDTRLWINGCTSLQSITFDGCTPSISLYGFSSISSLYFSDLQTYCQTSIPRALVDHWPTVYVNNLDISKQPSVTIPEGVTSISSSAFYNCTELRSVTISNSVQTINGFDGCTGLTSVIIPDGVKIISGFDGCTGLTSVIIPDSVYEISGFRGCTNLLQIENGVHYLDAWLIDCDTSVTSVTVRAGTKAISSFAFSGCSSLTSITIPDSVTSIGEYAFSYCRSLTSITIPDSVTSIGNYAFQDCSSLTSITIGDSVTSIGEGLFQGCSSLASITIPDSVTSIGKYAFDDCSSLTSITFQGTTAEWRAIKKDSPWNYNTGSYKIYCTDGTIAEDGTVTPNA